MIHHDTTMLSVSLVNTAVGRRAQNVRLFGSAIRSGMPYAFLAYGMTWYY